MTDRETLFAFGCHFHIRPVYRPHRQDGEGILPHASPYLQHPAGVGLKGVRPVHHRGCRRHPADSGRIPSGFEGAHRGKPGRLNHGDHMAKINLTDDELTKLLEAVNAGADRHPILPESSFPPSLGRQRR